MTTELNRLTDKALNEFTEAVRSCKPRTHLALINIAVETLRRQGLRDATIEDLIECIKTDKAFAKEYIPAAIDWINSNRG